MGDGGWVRDSLPERAAQEQGREEARAGAQRSLQSMGEGEAVGSHPAGS